MFEEVEVERVLEREVEIIRLCKSNVDRQTSIMCVSVDVTLVCEDSDVPQ